MSSFYLCNTCHNDRSSYSGITLFFLNICKTHSYSPEGKLMDLRWLSLKKGFLFLGGNVAI